MAMDPGIREELKQVVMRMKMLQREREQLLKDKELWTTRVHLATSKGLSDLAAQAQAKADDVEAKLTRNQLDLHQFEIEKDRLRYQSKRPSGQEVARSQAMLERVREGGLIDPDKAQLDRELEELVEFDFSDTKKPSP